MQIFEGKKLGNLLEQIKSFKIAKSRNQTLLQSLI